MRASHRSGPAPSDLAAATGVWVGLLRLGELHVASAGDFAVAGALGAIAGLAVVAGCRRRRYRGIGGGGAGCLGGGGGLGGGGVRIGGVLPGQQQAK